MKLQYHGMSLEGTPTELAAFVRQYETKPVVQYPKYPIQPFPWWWYTTAGTPTGTYTGTGLDTQWTK